MRTKAAPALACACLFLPSSSAGYRAINEGVCRSFERPVYSSSTAAGLLFTDFGWNDEVSLLGLSSTYMPVLVCLGIYNVLAGGFAIW